MHAKRKVVSVLASELMFGGRHFFPNFIISSLGLTMVRAVCARRRLSRQFFAGQASA